MTSLQVAAAPPPAAARHEVKSRSAYHPVFELHELIDTAGTCLAAATESSTTDSKAALLDAFLAVASICQVASDHVHRDVADLKRFAKYSSSLPRPAGPAAKGLLLGAARAGHRVRAVRQRSSVGWLANVEDFAAAIARVLWGRVDEEGTTLARRWAELATLPSDMPRHGIAIPPRCFFTFDQTPEDCIELAARYSNQHPDRELPILVVGLRTSGCFLAPIVAAHLGRLGFTDVAWTSWRPGQPRLLRDRTLTARAASRGGAAVIVDDPPTSGGSLARVAAELSDAGFRRDRVTLLLQLFPGTREWEDRLARWETIRLEWPDWHIHRLLDRAAIAGDMAELLTAGDPIRSNGHGPATHERAATVLGVTRMAVDPAEDEGIGIRARKHVRARYEVEVLSSNGSRFAREVFVHGVGLGMFGTMAESAARRLNGYVPDVIGLRHGLLFRDWVPSAAAVDESDERQREHLARAAARYAAHRASSLQVANDASSEMSGHDALWEQAARWLGEGFGRFALPLRPVLHGAGRRLLRPRRMSIIDGAMGPGRWYNSDGRLLKSGWDEGAFVYQIPFCYDAAFDVAAASSQRLPDEAFGRLARAEYEAASGRLIDDVHWFLYQLLSEADRQSWARRQGSAGGAPTDELIDALTAGERRSADLHRAYLSDSLLADLRPSESGELCAIDIDGVLESARRAYPTPDTAGLLALRALTVHGFRPVIATGRSIGESVRRCRDYRLAGAVAEYGSVVYDAATARTQVLLGPGAVADLEALRHALLHAGGVHLDPAFEHSVRAFTVRRGRRFAVPAEVVAQAVEAAGVASRVSIVAGWAQTDFVPAGIDKGTGLRALAGLMGVAREPVLALAVGDAMPDLAMFALARIAAAPANADSRLTAGGKVTSCRRSFGEGLAEAVAMLVGHAPGSCPICAAPKVRGVDAALLLALLQVGDVRGLRKLAAMARAVPLLLLD